MDEFFAGAEVEQQKQFIDKYVMHHWYFSFHEFGIFKIFWFLQRGKICRYNFDPVNDKPLLGRYEWEKVDS